jgi:TPR repeat protein
MILESTRTSIVSAKQTICHFISTKTPKKVKENKVTTVALASLAIFTLVYVARHSFTATKTPAAKETKAELSLVEQEKVESLEKEFIKFKETLTQEDLNLTSLESSYEELTETDASVDVIKAIKPLYIEIKFLYAKKCHYGKGKLQDLKQARKLYEEILSDHQYDPFSEEYKESLMGAQIHYAKLNHMQKNYSIAREVLKEIIAYDEKLIPESFKRNYGVAQFTYAEMCFKQEGGPLNMNDAEKYSKLASEGGNEKAKKLLKKILQAKSKLDEAREAIRESVKMSDSEYRGRCREMLRKSVGKELPEENKRTFLDMVSRYVIMCYEGEGGEKDFKEAKYRY